MTIDEMFKLIYRHNMMHLRDVRRALDAAQPAYRAAAAARHDGGDYERS